MRIHNGNAYNIDDTINIFNEVNIVDKECFFDENSSDAMVKRDDYDRLDGDNSNTSVDFFQQRTVVTVLDE